MGSPESASTPWQEERIADELLEARKYVFSRTMIGRIGWVGYIRLDAEFASRIPDAALAALLLPISIE